MRTALSVVLAGLLIILPVEKVLAQAVQQEAVTVQQTAPPSGAAHLFRVPPLTSNSARLLMTSFDGALLEPSLSNKDAIVEWSDWSDEKKLLVVIAVVVGLHVIF